MEGKGNGFSKSEGEKKDSGMFANKPQISKLEDQQKKPLFDQTINSGS